MHKATELSEALVSEAGAVIPADTLRAVGIRPGARVTFVRTARGSLVVLPVHGTAGGPSLRKVAGIAPRPDGMTPDADLAFLREVRAGDEGR